MSRRRSSRSTAASPDRGCLPGSVDRSPGGAPCPASVPVKVRVLNRAWFVQPLTYAATQEMRRCLPAPPFRPVRWLSQPWRGNLCRVRSRSALRLHRLNCAHHIHEPPALKVALATEGCRGRHEDPLDLLGALDELSSNGQEGGNHTRYMGRR